MDSSNNLSTKKDRNQKRQRDKFHKKKPSTNCENSNSEAQKSDPLSASTANVGYSPQPQRANRRSEPKTTNSNTATSTSSLSVQENKNLEGTSVVDHSHLKRETEEIAKLTKKFEKREIVSNWHRYSVPDNVEDHENIEDSSPAADFSDLLQMPMSRGGHLQLKEEQDWSSTSGGDLGGYFALDLKLLSLALNCVPAYERFRLPKEMFTEEEVEKFNTLADQAKKCYNSENIYDDSRIMNLLNENVSSLKDTQTSDEESNINNKNVIRKDLPQISTITAGSYFNEEITNKTEKKEVESNKNFIKSTAVVNRNKNSFVESNKKSYSQSNIQLPNEKNQNLSECKFDDSYLTISRKSTDTNLEMCTEQGSSSSLSKSNEKKSLFNQTDLCDNIENLSLQSINQNKNVSNVIKTDISTNSSKSKLEYENTNLKMHTKNISEKLDLNLGDDDDDDLDFLLTLKNTIVKDENKGISSTSVTDSSFLPGGAAKSQLAVEDKSELDDWLDSVLQE